MEYLRFYNCRTTVTGNADEAVKKYLSGKLEFTTDVTCTKHESGENHSCGGHCH